MGISPRSFIGSSSTKQGGFRYYKPGETILGKRLEDHLHFAIVYWHSFAEEGNDPFGGPTFECPWHPQDSIKNAQLKADIASDTFEILGQPYFCWHDVDPRPERGNLL